MRTCPTCGQPEIRENNKVNLEPVTGKCIPCLVVWAASFVKSMPSPAFDARKAQAGDKS